MTKGFSMGKKCAICGTPVDNMTRVLTCQKCRQNQSRQQGKGVAG